MYIEITLYHQNLRTAQNLNYSFLKKKSKVQTCYFLIHCLLFLLFFPRHCFMDDITSNAELCALDGVDVNTYRCTYIITSI